MYSSLLSWCGVKIQINRRLQKNMLQCCRVATYRESHKCSIAKSTRGWVDIEVQQCQADGTNHHHTPEEVWHSGPLSPAGEKWVRNVLIKLCMFLWCRVGYGVIVIGQEWNSVYCDVRTRGKRDRSGPLCVVWPCCGCVQTKYITTTSNHQLEKKTRT